MEIDSLQPILSWVSAHPYASYLVIFLISLAESLFLVGFLIPGLTLMLAIGTLIGAGYIEFWPAMIASILGAVAGDGLSFKIGQHYQQRMRDWYIFRRYPDLIVHRLLKSQILKNCFKIQKEWRQFSYIKISFIH